MTEVGIFAPSKPLETAVLFLVFNRLDTTMRVFDAIRTARPPRLYIAADGARESRPGEAEKVLAVREYVIKNVDWPCEVKTLFRENNLGCKYAVSGAITWFFDNEEQGIILEDDCFPSHSFFWFCEEMLNRYREDRRVFIISPYNRQNEWKKEDCDYFFSYFGGIWGWASWRRAWSQYDIDMNLLQKCNKGRRLQDLLGEKVGGIRAEQLNSVARNNISSWAYPWAFCRHINSGLAVVPSVSLVKNIGFGSDATHTRGTMLDNAELHEIALPCRENPIMIADSKYDHLFVVPNRISLLLVFINLMRWVMDSASRFVRMVKKNAKNNN